MDAMSLLAAPVWHFWIAVPLSIGAVGMTIAMAAVYFKKFVLPRYPRS